MKIKCPACSTVLSIPESAVGKIVKCPCGKQLRAPGGPAQAAPPAPARPTPARPTPARPTPARPAANPPAAAPMAPVGDLFDELSEGDFDPVAAVVRPGVKPPPPKMDGQTRKLLEENDPDAGKKGRRSKKKGGASSRSSSGSSSGASSARSRSYGGELASPWTRLGAAFIDGIFMNVVFFVCGFVGALLGVTVSADKLAEAEQGQLSEAESLEMAMKFAAAYGIVMAIGVLIVASIYAIMMIRSGQTLGKMACGIRVVDAGTRQIPDFVQGVLIRSWLANILYFVPFFGIVDQLMIFGDGHQCLHDKMANTVVVTA